MIHDTISIIAAMDTKRGIGKDNQLLFKIPSDMKRMKELTTGHPLIMGRKTFESLGRLLPDRTHIVITSNKDNLKNLNYQPHFIAASLEDALDIAKQSPGSDEIFIFGGASVYAQAIDKKLANKLYLTIVQGNYNADAYFPPYGEYKQIRIENHEENGLKFAFAEFIKV